MLSLGATFGMIFLIFGGEGVNNTIGIDATGYFSGQLFVFIFSVGFGLSVDYELFLISKIQENYLLCKDNRVAILTALNETSGLITSAAIMFSIVTACFMISDMFFIKVIGLGLAIAVMLDSTIVRMLMVPSFLILMGDWNWYCPKPLLTVFNWLNVDEPPDTLGSYDAGGGRQT